MAFLTLLGSLLFAVGHAALLQPMSKTGSLIQTSARVQSNLDPPVTKGLILHLDAESYGSGEKIWKDLSPARNHADLVLKNGASTCVTQKKVFNTKTYTALKLETNVGFTIRGSFPKPYTMFIVDQLEVGGRSRMGLSLQSQDLDWYLGKWNGRNAHYANRYVGQAAGYAEPGHPDISCASLTGGGQVEFYQNDVLQAKAKHCSGPIRLALGDAGIKPGLVDGYVAKVLVYNRVLSNVERSQVSWYLHDRYGMTVPTLGLCKDNNGGCDGKTVCTDVRYERKCGPCPKGYNGDGLQGCTDINECLAANGGCDPRSECKNTAGSYECGKCPKGWIGNGREGCTDENECLDENGGCDRLSQCINTAGGNKCGKCPSGYTGDGKTGCEDIDECTINNGKCDSLTQCINAPGTNTCGLCPKGYQGHGSIGCQDVDECQHANGGCHILSKCENIPGGRKCGPCPSGYTGDGEKGCEDINECTKKNGDCDMLSKCVNLPGHHRCGPCPRGYTGTGSSGCLDIDECERYNGKCHPLTMCTNIDGGRTCGECPPGYEGNGYIGCEKPYEGSKTESTDKMMDRVAENAAKKKIDEIETDHATKLKNTILEEEEQEKKDRLRRLQMKTKQLELLTQKELKKREADDKQEKRLHDELEKKKQEVIEQKEFATAKKAVFSVKDKLVQKYGKTLEDAINQLKP